MENENVENNKRCLQNKLRLKRTITDSCQNTVDLEMKIFNSDKSSSAEDSLKDFKSPKEETKIKPFLSKFKKDPKKVKKKLVPTKQKTKNTISQLNTNQPSIESSFFKSETENKNEIKESKPCPVCLKPFKDDIAITNHIKTCLVVKNISVKQFIEAKKLQDRQAQERKAMGLLAAPVLAEKKKSSRKNHGNIDDAQLQLVLAMSESLYQEEQKNHLEEAALLAGISPQIIQEMNDEERRSTLQNFGFTTNKPTCCPPVISKIKKKRLHGPTILQTRSKEESERVLTERIACIVTGDENYTQVSQKNDLNLLENNKVILRSHILKQIEQRNERLWDKSSLIKKNTNFYVNELKSHFFSTTNEKDELSDSKLAHQLSYNEDNSLSDNLALYEPLDTDFLFVEENKQNNSIKPKIHISKKMNTEMDFINKLASDWSEALNNNKESDVVIFIKNNAKIYAHKLIFHWRCQKILRDIQLNDTTSRIKEKICWIENNEISVLAFLEFLYCGKIEKNFSVFSHNKFISEVQSLAEIYEMQDLIAYLQMKQDQYCVDKGVISESENDIHEALTPKDIHRAVTPPNIHEAITPQVSPSGSINVGSDDDSFYTAVTPPKLTETESQKIKDLPKTDLTLFIEKVRRINAKSPLDSFTDDSELATDFPVKRKNPFSKKSDDSLEYSKNETSKSQKCRHVISLLEKDVQKSKINKTSENYADNVDNNKSLINRVLTDNSVADNSGILYSENVSKISEITQNTSKIEEQNCLELSDAMLSQKERKYQSLINKSLNSTKQLEQTRNEKLSVSSDEHESLNDSQLSAYSKYKKYNVNNSIYKYRAELNSSFWKNLSKDDTSSEPTNIETNNKSAIFSKKVASNIQQNTVLEDVTLVSDSEDEELFSINLKHKKLTSTIDTDIERSSIALQKNSKLLDASESQNKIKRDFIEIALDSDEEDLFDDSSFLTKPEKSSYCMKNKKCKKDSNISEHYSKVSEVCHNQIEAEINKILESDFNTSVLEESENVEPKLDIVINNETHKEKCDAINLSPITIDSSPEGFELNENCIKQSVCKNVKQTKCNNPRNVNIKKKKTIEPDTEENQFCDEPSKNVTLPIDYSMLETPELKKELHKFGVKPLEKSKAKRLLKHIYNETHKTGPTSNSSKPSTSKKSNERLLIAEEMEYEDIDTDSVSDNPVSIKDIFFRLIKTNKELYTKVLTYEPVPLEALHLMMKQNGVKIKINNLMDFLDEQCITFQMQTGKTNRSNKKQ